MEKFYKCNWCWELKINSFVFFCSKWFNDNVFLDVFFDIYLDVFIDVYLDVFFDVYLDFFFDVYLDVFYVILFKLFDKLLFGGCCILYMIEYFIKFWYILDFKYW